MTQGTPVTIAQTTATTTTTVAPFSSVSSPSTLFSKKFDMTVDYNADAQGRLVEEGMSEDDEDHFADGADGVDAAAAAAAAGFQEAPSTPVTPAQKRRGGGRPKPKIVIQGEGVKVEPAAGVRVFADKAAYEKYVRRRVNNNLAASKSREKKRAVDSVNQVRVSELEAENKQLKDELQSLRHQVKYLDDLMQKLIAAKSSSS